MLDHGSFVTLRHAGGAVPAALDVGGEGGENVAFPLAGGESRKSVQRIGGRVRTSVHPKGVERLAGLAVGLDRDQLLGDGITILPDAIVLRSVENIGRRVAGALLLPH